MLVNGINRVNHFVAQVVSYFAVFFAGSAPLRENYYTENVISRKAKLSQYGCPKTQGCVADLSEMILRLRQRFFEHREETAHVQPIHQSVMHFYGNRQASNIAVLLEFSESNSRY